MIKEMDACDHERGSKTFSILYDEANVTKNTGGKRVYIERAQKCGLPYHCADHEMRGIIDMESGKKIAVHLRLAFEFNKQTVYW